VSGASWVGCRPNAKKETYTVTIGGGWLSFVTLHH